MDGLFDVELSYPESLPPAKSPPEEVMKTELERPLTRLMEKVGNTSLCSSRETVYKAALDKAEELELSNTEYKAANDPKSNEEPNENRQAAHGIEVLSGVAATLELSANENVIEENGGGKKEGVGCLVDEVGFLKAANEDEVASVVYSDSEYSQDDE